MNELPKGTKTASLRWRLTLVSLTMLVLALVALDAAIYVGLHQRYYSDLRANMTAVMTHASGYSPSDKESLQVTANRLSRQNVVAIIGLPGAYPVIGKLLDSPQPKLAPVEGPPVTPDAAFADFVSAIYARSDLYPQMKNSMTGVSSSAAPVLFVASKSPVESSLRRLLIAELIGTLLVVALAVVIVGVAIRLTLRPLDRMATVADRIAGGDISERLRPSKGSTELGRLATALDAMLESLSESLTSERRAHENASRSEERMRDFLSDASHELRTPIAGLQWSAEALLRHGHERERREQLSFEIVRQARRASQLVSDLLAMARLDQGLKLERKPVELGELAEEEIESIRQREPRLELRLTSEGGCSLVADPERIRQVISNLLDNACKATDGAGEIDVTVRRKGALAELEVRDSGPGVPPGDKERIFERFVRLDGARATKQRYGSGLGLAIARGLAEAHGGSLTCAECKAGARFLLELPLSGRVERGEPVRAAHAS
ncbi:MAG: HAMP domain-containing sensor histidine kinase [Gaiellaceae bacterium]